MPEFTDGKSISKLRVEKVSYDVMDIRIHI